MFTSIGLALGLADAVVQFLRGRVVDHAQTICPMRPRSTSAPNASESMMSFGVGLIFAPSMGYGEPELLGYKNPSTCLLNADGGYASFWLESSISAAYERGSLRI